jgi:hypothetical protein
MKTFENAMSLSDILDMPYCLFEDLILKQIQIKKKEAKAMKSVRYK